MKIVDLEDMKGGWFVGDFDPVVYKTKEFEVGVKYYRKGDSEPRHVHKIGTELTLICSGRVRMNGQIIEDKEIVIMHPGPINRGVEITSDVADSQQAIILNQVENGVAVRMAVIYLLASKIKQ